MNVVFISPNFPLYYWNFCDRLKKRGVNVLGIGDASYDSMSEACRHSLTEYYQVSSLENFEEVYRACGYFTHRYGKLDWIESENEYWLETEATLRQEFNVNSGTKIKDMGPMKYKSKMKDVYAKAGIKACRYHMVSSYEDAKDFIRQVGYPVVVKPDNGVGAAATYKLKNEDELNYFFATKNDVAYIMEEFVPGHVETFDGITDSKKNILVCSSHVMLVSIMDTVNEGTDTCFCSQNVEEMDIYEIGKKVVQAFDTRSRFFHFEFFRLDEDKEGLGKKGDLLGLEVNMRAPGAYMPDMINYACDCDVYDIWAEMLVNDCMDQQIKRKYYVGYAARRYDFQYRYSMEEIKAMYQNHILVDTSIPKALAGAMGDHVFLFRHESREVMMEILQKILEK